VRAGGAEENNLKTSSTVASSMKCLSSGCVVWVVSIVVLEVIIDESNVILMSFRGS